ncbi:MAG TPA: hypothetical protein VIC26_02805 [Marinagarivorans sp.]
MMLIQAAKILLISAVLITLHGCCGAPAAGSGPTTSISGSTAAMLTYEDTLYTLHNGVIKIFDLSQPDVPEPTHTLYASQAETLFISKAHLFVGGMSGVRTFSLADPLAPAEVSFYHHARGCDPIIIEGDIGYVTLRNRPGCNGDVNRLEILDFSDPSKPKELARYDMQFPYGLTVLPDHLAVCEDNYGLALLDINWAGEIPDVSEAARYENIHCFDLIYAGNNLIATASDGIYQFSVDNEFLGLQSKIPVGITAHAATTAGAP